LTRLEPVAKSTFPSAHILYVNHWTILVGGSSLAKTVKASHVAVLLYFLAGLLPEPEGPWTPGSAHCWAWLIATLVEATILGIFASVPEFLRVPNSFIHILDVMGVCRIVTLLLMAATLIVRDYQLRPALPQSAPEERESLLENGHASSESYGSVPTKPSGAAKRTQVSGTGWLEYFAGFRVLFPYLWYAIEMLSNRVSFANLNQA
jgi:hypothetical protein